MVKSAPHLRDNSPSARPSPYLFERRLRSRAAHRLAEAAWSLYPPAAILLAVLLLAAGCRGGSNGADARLGGASRDEGPTRVAAAPAEYPSYPIETPLVGTADGRATAYYGKDRLEIVNLSEQAWPQTRIWVNHRYSALLPHTRPGEVRSIHFSFLRDEQGRTFPTDNMEIRVESVELVTGDERTKVPFGLGY